MKLYEIFMFLILHLIGSVSGQENGYYSVIAPGTLKSNRKFTVAITLHDAPEPATVRVGIVGPSYTESEQVIVRPLETKRVHFMPSKLKEGTYSFYAEGLSGLKFRNDSLLQVVTDSGPKIYVQTDKAVYKPSDVVQFRVVMLDEHTKPVNISEPIRVEILGGNDNRIKQFKDITFIQGVFTGKFNLSEYPAMGHWKVITTISGKYAFSAQKWFRVKKYVLPKFYVHIEHPDDVTPYNPVIKITFYGKYTFDKYVEGNATVSLSDNNHGIGTLQEKQMQVKGITNVEFKIVNLEDFEENTLIAVKVILEEKYSGRIQYNVEYFRIHKQQYDISVDIDDINFRDTKPYRLTAQVKQWNGNVIMDRETPIYMTHGGQTYETHLNDEGVATFEFEHKSNANYEFKFKDSSATLPEIYTTDFLKYNNTEFFCRLILLSGKPRLGKIIEIEVSSSEAIPYIVYTVTGHANVIRMELVKMPNNTKSHIIRLKPTIEMIPKSFVYVHYVHRGNFRYEEIELNFPFEFENKISVIGPQQTRPGQEVNLNIKAQPNSYVCILAVDLSVYLLDKSYDLDRHGILSELYGDRTFSPLKSARYPGVISGVLTLTNAHYPFDDYSETYIPGSPGSGAGTLRRKFPETWIFQNMFVTNETTQLTLEIPDTITTWRITAFSINKVTGFGIVDGPTDILTIQPFFVDLNLPYSVKRGEVVTIPITIFNYHNRSLDAEVTMYNRDEEYDFMESEKDIMKKSHSRKKRNTENINVPANSGAIVSFMITPRKFGEISLNITANTELSSDAILKKLRVEPEGTQKYDNKAMLITMRASAEGMASTITAEIPEDIVLESEHITLSMGGDALVPTLDNLNDLVLMPTGCGEQNMVNFAPNILILLYLKAIGKYAQERKLVAEAKNFIEIGYQQELSFRHPSGGYSVFGATADKGVASTWLTAYVIRFFIKAAKFSSIEERIITSGLDYLASNQQPNGEFAYTGYLFHPAQQNRFGFTAFVLMTFLEDRKYSMKYKKIIQKGQNFLIDNLGKDHDVYALSIMATALQMAKHPNSTKVLDKLNELSMEKDGFRWWSGHDVNSEKDVEITAYALTALAETPGDHTPILKWLMKQRNSQGGFKSTHDTVVGLQALVKYFQLNPANDLDMHLQYIAKNEEGNTIESNEFSLDARNSLVLQTRELHRSTRSISFKATGSGQSLLQLSSLYYMDSAEDPEHFQIIASAENGNINQINVDVCFTYRQKNATTGSEFSNMVIMELNLPSGYRSDAEFSRDLLEMELIQRIESKNEQTTVVIYFDNLAANQRHCITISADKTHEVLKRKPAAIRMYDYYNTNRANTIFYTID